MQFETQPVEPAMESAPLKKREQKQALKQQAKFLEIPDEPEENAITVENTAMPQSRKGRKRERDDLYFIKGQKKIADAQHMLRTQYQTLTFKQKQGLRNQISAQKSRLIKKEEAMFLNNEVREKDKKYHDIVKTLLGIMSEDQARELQSKLSQ